jgi:predicted nucleic acid-binding protein
MLFVDTAGWVAAADAADRLNDAVCRARDGWLEAGGLLVTSDYVIDETLTTLRFRLSLAAAERWWTQLEGSTRLRLEGVDGARAEKARALFFRYRDKELSLTDCTSFIVMKELRLRQVLTLDRHFGQMGFELLPQP